MHKDGEILVKIDEKEEREIDFWGASKAEFDVAVHMTEFQGFWVTI